MLNIDYSTPRKFLMSFGITICLLGFTIFFGAGMFITDRLDSLKGAIVENNSLVMDLYNQTYPNIFKTLTMINYFSIILVILGAICFLIGIYAWGKEDKKNVSKKPKPKKTKKFSLINELKELWEIWWKLIVELFLIVGSIILTLKFTSTENPPWILGVILILGAVAIKVGMKEENLA